MDAEELLERIDLNGDSETACSAVEAVEAVKRNCSTLKEIETLARPLLCSAITPTEEAKAVLSEESAQSVLRPFLKSIEESEEVSIIEPGKYKEIIEKCKREAGVKGRKLFMPIRCALTGRTDGIELEKIVQLLGNKTIIERLAKAL